MFISYKSLLQTLFIVVRPTTTSSTSAQTPCSADLLAAVEEQDALQVHFLSHLLGPALQIVLVPREPVNQEVVLFTLGHSPLWQKQFSVYEVSRALLDLTEQRTSNFHWNNCTICDMMLY